MANFRTALLAVGSVLSVMGCAISVGPESSVPGQTEWIAIDFERFKVESNSYPKFQARQSMSPPAIAREIPLTDIKDTDLWAVRYRLNDFYLIFSETYNDRQCRHLVEIKKGLGIAGNSLFTDKCNSRYFYCIVIDLKGNVIGNWELVPNPDLAISTSARSVSFKPLTPKAGDWGVQPLFKAVN